MFDKNERPVVLHQGVYKKQASVGDAVFIITGMTIGAGVLGLPYVVAQSGLKIGLLLILLWGAAMLFLNLMIGEIAVRTRAALQLPGFAGKYLGKWAKVVLSFTIVLSSLGVLLAYVVGEGQSLSALFGGSPLVWSLGFWFLGSVMIWRGLDTVKTLEKFMSLAVMGIIFFLSLYLLPEIKQTNWQYLDWGRFFLPYGVILFALHASPAVVEAHALMPGSERHYRKAVIIGTLIPTALYMLFALAVAGSQGLNSTELATVGLGASYGGWVMILGNLFAILAMGTAFMGMGVALKQIFMWDYKVKPFWAGTITTVVPLALLLFGVQSFFVILDLVGGLFVGIEAIMMVLIYWRARQVGDLAARRYKLNHFWLLAVPVLLVFTIATVYSIIKLF